MDRRVARYAVFLWMTVSLALAACQTPTATIRPTAEPTTAVVTRWPTHTPTATHTPLPTLTPTATRAPSPTPFPDLTLAQIRNLTYPNEWAVDGVADMVDGSYHESANVGSGTDLVITMADMITFGDLDGDHRDDAVVLLVVHPGDSSSYIYLNVVTGRGGEAEPSAALPLGEKVVLRSMVVATGRLTLEMLTYDVDDAPCCPSLDSRRVYELEGDTLSLVSQWDGPRQQSAAPLIPARQPLPFASGTSATLVRGSLYPLGDQRFVLPGQAGQLLELGVTSPRELVFLSLRGLNDGVVLTSIVSETIRWSGEFPSTQDYQITLVSIAGQATSYALAALVDPPFATPIPTLTLSVATPTATVQLTPTLAATPALTSTQMPAVTATPVPQAAEPVTSRAQVVVPPGSLLYLTFDGDADASGWTQTVVDVLIRNGVRGTFFLPDPADPRAHALVQSGHAVGLSLETAMTSDAIGRQALVEMLTALDPVASVVATRCVRPSYGAMDAYVRAMVAEMGDEVALWDISPVTAAVDGDVLSAELLSQVHPGAVLRFYIRDNGVQTATVLSQTLPLLEAQGYGFGTLCSGSDSE